MLTGERAEREEAERRTFTGRGPGWNEAVLGRRRGCDSREHEQDWQLSEQRLTALPADTAYLQVWALAFNARHDVCFDDLELVDERAERLFAFRPDRALPELASLADKVGDAQLRTEAAALATRARDLLASVRQPADASVQAYLAHVHELDDVVRRIDDMIWDLKILGLAK